MRRPSALCISPSIRGCSPPTRRWPRSRSRSGPPKTSRSGSPRSAKTVPASPNSRGADMSGPLSGIRVVDFSRVLAGPFCARTLLDLGAEVIKIEPPRPDVSRFAFPSTPGMSGYYAQQNAGKRNVSIDLNVPGARELALRLCDTADVVVEFPRRHAALFRARLSDAGCPQPTPDLCLDHRLWSGRAMAGPDGLRPDGAGRGWLHPQQHAPLRRRPRRAAHRQPVACRRLCRPAGCNRDPGGIASALG